MGESADKFLREAKNIPWLSIGLGVCATIIGIILAATNARSTTDDSNLYLILGGILTAFGPVAISHAVSKNIGRNEVRENMQNHIRAVSMNLGQSLSSLSHSLTTHTSGADDARTTLRLVESVVPVLEVQITELQRLVGSPFSAEEQLRTKAELKPLVADLQKAFLEGDTEGMKDTTVKIQRGLRKSVQVPVLTARESYPCIECGHGIVCDVGVKAGSTVQVDCDMCGTSFNVHRGPNGLFGKALQVRPARAPKRATDEMPPVVVPPEQVDAEPGANPEPTREKGKLTVICPTCSVSYEVSGNAQTWPKTVVCYTCNLGLSVDDQATVLGSVKYQEREATILRFAGKAVIVKCPECGRRRRCGYRRAESMHGYCISDQLVFTVSAEMAAAWRSQDAATTAPAVTE